MAKCNIALGDANAALSVLRQVAEFEPGNKSVRDEMINANALLRYGEEIEKATLKKDYRTVSKFLPLLVLVLLVVFFFLFSFYPSLVSSSLVYCTSANFTLQMKFHSWPAGDSKFESKIWIGT